MNNTTGHAHDATAWLQLARRLQKQQLQQLSQLGELASQLSALPATARARSRLA